MEANLFLGMSSLVIATGAGAAMLVLHRKNGNGNGHHAPPPSEGLTMEQLVAVVGGATAKAIDEVVQPLAHLPVRLEQSYRHLLETQIKEPEIPPDWAARMLGDLDHIDEKLGAPPPRNYELEQVNANLERFTEVVEKVLQTPPPQPQMDFSPVVNSMKALSAQLQTIEAIPREFGAVLAAERRGLKAAAGGSSGGTSHAPNQPPPPRRQPPPGFRAAPPGTLPGTPSIPAAYVAGSIFVPAGQASNLLVLIQTQLSPNCPPSSVELLLEADDPMLVGGASQIAGPLTATNFGYQLVPGTPRIYRSSYPGNNTPIGELQIFSASGGYLHVEVQS